MWRDTKLNGVIKTLITTSLILLISFSSNVSFSEESSALTPHSSIFIDGNGDFTSGNGVVFGNGTPSNPYVIEGWEINASTSIGIEIRNSNASFVVRNLSVHSGFFGYDGISLYNVTRGFIDNVTVCDNLLGISVSYSESSGITNSTLSNNRVGVSLYSVNYSTVGNNTLSGNLYGIDARQSSRNLVANNTVSNVRYGMYLVEFNGSVLANNAVSGNDWYGVYLADSNNNIFARNIITSNPEDGIYVKRSFAIEISNNTISKNVDGLITSYSQDVTIVDNDISWNYMLGMVISFSSRGTVVNNTMIDDGISMEGNTLEHWTSHRIETSNSVNGKPVIYWKNASSGTVPPGAGEVILANCTNVYVENQNVSGGSVGILLGLSSNNTITNNTVPNHSAGISLRYSYNNTVTNNTDIVSSRGSGVYLHLSSDNTVADNTIWDSNMGILLFHSTRNTIVNNWLSSSYWHGIGLKYSDENLVVGNNVSDNHDGVHLGHSSNNTVIGNLATRCWYGIYLEYSSNNNTIVNNNASKDRYGIYLLRPLSNFIANNTAFFNRWDGIYLESSHYNVIVNNNASLNERDGINLNAASRGALANNTVNSNIRNGIHSWSANNNTIVNNTALFNGVVGFYLDSFTINATVMDNVALSNSQGYYLYYASRNSVVNNSAMDNSFDGIQLVSSNNNRISQNLVSSNDRFGIRLGSSINNRIYHNNIVDNGQQAFDDTDSNQWDDGYPSGGNYWSDYMGFDFFSGPNQDQPGGDGIGDMPYVIDVDSQDRYPLLARFGYPLPPDMVQAALDGIDFQNITVTWTLSLDDGTKSTSVLGYEVYRGTAYQPEGEGYHLVVSLPNGTFQFNDSYRGEGDANGYFYRVCAFDLDNKTTCATDQAAKFTRPLSKGPNLISIPLIQSDESIQTVLQTVSYSNAWSYDPVNQEWKSFSKSKPYAQSLEYLNHTMGIWVNVTQDSNLTVAGVVPTSTTIDLQAGWNLVGFPSFDDDYTVADLKAAIMVERIEGFDGSAPPYFLRVMGDGDFLQAGFGYWIRVESPSIWTVQNT